MSPYTLNSSAHTCKMTFFVLPKSQVTFLNMDAYHVKLSEQEWIGFGHHFIWLYA